MSVKIATKNQNNVFDSKLQSLMNNGRYNEAAELIKKSMMFYFSKDINYALGDCYLKAKNYELAKNYFLKSLEKFKDKIDTIDKLVIVYFHLNEIENFKKFGNHAISLRDKDSVTNITLSASGLNPDKKKNIISFSIFGNSPRYCETAILNVIEAKRLYPQWTCRFYIDDTVPKEIKQRLVDHGAELILVTDNIKKSIHGTMWRFLVIDDNNIDRFLIRDADSLLSTREKYAVDNWIESKKCFHIMRDAYTHTDMILAGMWGGVTGVIENMEQQILKYIKKAHNKFGIDQQFLRDIVWKQIKSSVLHHDSIFNYKDSVDFPAHPVEDNEHENKKNFHVGWDISSEFSIPSSRSNGEKYSWNIVDKKNNIICKYEGVVKNSKYSFIVPIPYLKKIESKEWRVKIL